MIDEDERRLRFRGVFAATTTPFRADGSFDRERFAEHCGWLISEGVRGLIPNGSLGEYETLTEAERRQAVEVAASAAAGTALLVPGVSGRSAAEAASWAGHARDCGADAVMCLPPTSHAPSDDEVVAHFRAVAGAGLPVIAYNNPFSTRVDLTPPLLGRLARIEGIAGVKEFSQDVRRVGQIGALAPSLEILVGCDDLVAEATLMGATGWIAGFVNTLPGACVRLFDLCTAGEWGEALALYRSLLPMLRWDAATSFVQAVKIAQEEAGRYGGPVRLPRLPLDAQTEAAIRKSVRLAIEGCGR